MHQSAILFYQFYPSVHLSVCTVLVLYHNEWTYRQTFFNISVRDIILVFIALPPLQNSKGNPLSGGAKY